MGRVFLNFRFRRLIVSFILIIVCVAFVVSSIPSSSPALKQPLPSTDRKNTRNAIDVHPLSSTLRGVNIGGKTKIPASFIRLKDKYHLVAIPTYDGSYQLTHPKVLYFPKAWKGYKYWMSMTPYPREIDNYENPSIVVSNDGNTWAPPAGLKNPVSGLPNDGKTGGHYSDPQLVMRGDVMELWYRYNPALANKMNRRRPDNSINTYYRKTTKDGIHWTEAQKLLQSRDGHLSLCVNFENGLYKTWYATYGGDLCYSESKNAVDWSAPVYCSVPLPKGLVPYHQDIIKNGSQYYLLQTAQQKSNYTFQLFLATSKDGIHFSNAQKICPNKDMALWKNVSFYRSTLFVKDNKLNLYVSLIIPHLKWYMTQMTLPLPQLHSNADTNKTSSAVKI